MVLCPADAITSHLTCTTECLATLDRSALVGVVGALEATAARGGHAISWTNGSAKRAFGAKGAIGRPGRGRQKAEWRSSAQSSAMERHRCGVPVVRTSS